MKSLTISELNKLYDEAETVDREVFAEARSNVLLLAGEHYQKRDKQDTFREPHKGSDNLKLRLVKNHVHKIVRHYVTSILSYAPGTQVVPFDETSLQDEKEAQLNQSVWEAAKPEHRIDEKIRKWCFDFVGTGEVAVKIFFDPNAGELAGYEPEVDDDGMPVLDEMGQPTPDEDRPVFKGKFTFEPIFEANLLRSASAKDMHEADFIIRKMMLVSDLKARYKDDPDKLRFVSETGDEDFIVFDSARSTYNKSKGECLVREYYFRPCQQFPEGYFFITTSVGILEEGALPYGIFPIAWAGFDEFPTSPRGRAITKVARPYVAEINRASSAMAMHQVTIGDDKIIYQSGTKLAPGSLLPGVRGITYQGREPTVLPGRDGGQYLNYINAQIAEMYSVVMLEEIDIEKGQNLDPYALIFRSAKQQTKFSIYSEKFQQFLIDVVTIYLSLAKYYLPDDCLIPAIGKREMVNISEFRSTTPLRYQIKVLPREDTIETLLGRQLQQQNFLQYAGNQLTRDDVGKLMKESPFGNNKEIFDDLTMDWENAKNDMLALDRGENPPVSQADSADYMLKKLTSRTRKPDFRFLAPEIQQAYQMRIQQYQQLKAQQQQQLMAAEADFIPTDGAMVSADMYVNDPQNPMGQPKKAKYPQRALEWLAKRLEDQGADLAQLEMQSTGTQAQIAQMFLNGQQSQGGSGQIQPPTGNGMTAGPYGQVG